MKTVAYPLLSFAVLVSTCFAAPLSGKLDREVRELCAKDGGLTVYETVSLPPDKVSSSGWPTFQIPLKGYLWPDDVFYFERDVRGDQTADRAQVRLIRAADKKVLAEYASYVPRIGRPRDPPIWHPSTISCPPVAAAEEKLVTGVFRKEVQPLPFRP